MVQDEGDIVGIFLVGLVEGPVNMLSIDQLLLTLLADTCHAARCLVRKAQGLTGGGDQGWILLPGERPGLRSGPSAWEMP